MKSSVTLQRQSIINRSRNLQRTEFDCAAVVARTIALPTTRLNGQGHGRISSCGRAWQGGRVEGGFQGRELGASPTDHPQKIYLISSFHFHLNFIHQTPVHYQFITHCAAGRSAPSRSIVLYPSLEQIVLHSCPTAIIFPSAQVR